MSKLPAEYFETRFRCEILPQEWPANFVIITAYATTGEHWSNERNLEADRCLESELRSREIWIWRVTGYSPTTGHAEPGWASDLSLQAARQLGSEFLQHAIYVVSDGILLVTLCESDAPIVEVARFSERLSLVV